MLLDVENELILLRHFKQMLGLFFFEEADGEKDQAHFGKKN